MANYVAIIAADARHYVQYREGDDPEAFCSKVRGLARSMFARSALYGVPRYPEVACYQHGIPGAGGLPCIGRCDICTQVGVNETNLAAGIRRTDFVDQDAYLSALTDFAVAREVVLFGNGIRT